MGFRFNKRVKICKGVTLNLGKKGASVSVGTKGARVTVGKNGTRTTVGIPGTGISYTDYKKHGAKEVKREEVQQLQLIYLAVNKKFRVAFHMQRAINAYELYKIEESYKYCNKALKINPKCKEAIILLNNITG